MRNYWIPVVALVLLIVTSGLAEARKIWVPIPSFSQGETMVKVRDLPKGQPFLDKEGNQISLGYLWKSNGEGQWVGYISPSRYLTWSPQVAAAVVVVAGLGTLPPIPERPADMSSVGGFGGLFWGIIIALGLAWKIFSKFFRSTTQAEANLQSGPAAEDGQWVERAGPAIASTTSRVVSGAPQVIAPSRQPRTVSGTASRASFGRR